MRIVTLTAWLFAASALAAEENDSRGVHLMRPDSLAGWAYGSQPPSGWTIQRGTLCGGDSSTPLLSGFTFGDFRLRFTWSVDEKAAWQVLLPEVPVGPGLRLALCEGEGCARLDDAGKTLAAGASLASLAGGMHKVQLDRSGGKLTLTIDDRQFWQVTLAPSRRFGLGLAVAGGQARLADLCVEELAGEPIFNGKDLAGWWTPGDKSAWTVENNEIVLRKEGGNYLRTEKEYANFTLSLEYKIQKGGNSGVGIRTPRPAWPSGDGMEIQLWDVPYSRPLDKHAPGAIYGNVPPLARADKSGQYNHVVIKADGWMISVWINGQLVQQCYTGDHPELKRRRLKGWIGLQDHNARTEFRNIRLLEAPPGPGLDAWQKPRTPCAATVVIDRLMNSERLAVPDGVQSAVARARVEGKKADGQVLAELTGPGAVVRLARTRDEGRLAFFFDGEEKPRLECKPADLWQAAPQLTEDANPVLTCLTYRRSLKIVLRDAASGDWWIDHVAFPKSLSQDHPGRSQTSEVLKTSEVFGIGSKYLSVESYSARDANIPRAWLAAAMYRHEQFGWGVHREFDPWPRPSSGPKTIQPGKPQRMIHIDGAGIVHWVKLAADKRVLNNNDLWLEVRVDGQKEPAVATPVRFWFPGLVGSGNYPNYVLLDRNGMTNVLAMPFGAGIELSLVNRGKKPIQGVGLSVSLEPATDKTREDIQNLMRLRAVFEPAGNAGKDLAHCKSHGRWIGLIYEEPKGAQTAIESLVTDGKTANGWNGSTLDALLGRSGDFRTCLSGRRGPLVWRYLLLEPVDFRESFQLTTAGPKLGNRLAIFYAP